MAKGRGGLSAVDDHWSRWRKGRKGRNGTRWVRSMDEGMVGDWG